MTINRIQPGPRMSGAVVHGNTVYLAGLTADDISLDVKGQTQQILSKIDKRLAEAGSDKSKILSANICEPCTVTRSAALRTLSTSSARRSTKPSSATGNEMRLTHVPECGRMSTKPSSTSLCNASLTGVRDSLKRSAMSFS